MYSVKRSAIVPYSALEMYDLVADLDQYQKFLPWCGGSNTLERDGERVVAKIDIDFKGLKKSFVTENKIVAGQSIEMHLKSGPFRSLNGIWKFQPLSSSSARVALDLEFEFSGAIVDRLLGPVFSSISGSMVDSFVKRAEQVYGRRKLDFS